MKVVLLPRAQQDLRQTLDYFERHGSSSSVSRRFLVSFEQTCLLLADHPQIGQKEEPPPGSPHAQADVRRFPVRRFPSYLIFFKADQTSLLIQRILHAARDPSLRLADPSK